MIIRKRCFMVNKSFIFGIAAGLFLVYLVTTMKMATTRNYSQFYSKKKPNKSLDIPSVSAQTYQTILDATECNNVYLRTKYAQRGNYWVLYNFIQADQEFKCYESVTYTTQGTYEFLDNLIILAEKWRGPISVAVHAPGKDFRISLEKIAWLRNCASPLIKKFVTFHLFFDENQAPKIVQLKKKAILGAYEDRHDCKHPIPLNRFIKQSYRIANQIPYAINVARNIARESAQTHYILASDIELFPSRNFIPNFLNMLAKRPVFMSKNERKVFVLPLFEVSEDQVVPEDKTRLQMMVKNKTAVVFHHTLCTKCHMVINGSQWIAARETEGLDVFSHGKRLGGKKNWEPFFVGTNDEPMFDERLTWEGQSNKMTQGYLMCILDYEYMILDNAFLVHTPGIKKKKAQLTEHNVLVHKTNVMLKKVIRPELDALYGTREGCDL